MKQIKALAGQTLIYGMGTIVPRLLNYLLLTPFYTRVFLQQEYGVVTELYAYAAFLIVLLTYGMETSFFRFSEKEKEPGRVFSTAMISLLITSALFMLLVSVFSGPVSGAIQYSANSEYIVYFALIIGLDAFTSIPFARLRQQNRPLRFTIIRIINVSVNIALNLFFLVLCPYLLKTNPGSPLLGFYDPSIGVGYAFISNLVSSIVSLLLLMPVIIKVKWIFDTGIWKRMLAYAWPLLVIGLAGMVNEVADKILLKYLLPDKSTAMAQLGIYGANFKLAVLMTIFIQMFRFAAEPFFFAQEKEKNARDIYAAVMKYFVIFALFIFLGVMLYLDIVKYFIGSNYHEGLMIVPIVLAANLFLGIFYNLSVWYKLNNLTLYGAVIALSGAALTLAMNFILVPHIGYLGSAWAHFSCYFLMMVFSYFWGKKHFPVQYDLKRIGLYFILTAVLFVFKKSIAFDSEIINYLFSTVLIGIFVYMVYRLEWRAFQKA